VEEAEDDGADDSEDEHESALTKEPFADFALGPFERAVEALALRGGKEREEEPVGVFALEHEVDAEEGGGNDVEEVSEPERKVGEEITGSGGDGAFCALDHGVQAKPVGEGNFFDFGNEAGKALREFGGEVAEIAQDRRQARGEEEGEDKGDDDDQNDDGDRAGGVVAAKVEFGDVGDCGPEDDSEESADVEDQELFLEGPCEGEKEEDDDGEEDVAANLCAGSLLVGCELAGGGIGQRGVSWGEG
jgi:hypothetical protein